METERITLSHRERDRLKVLHEVQQKHLSQVAAAVRLKVSDRQVRRMLLRIRERGDGAVVHGLRGRPSNRKLAARLEQKILARLRQRYADFGPTLAAEHLAQEGFSVSRETLRKWMVKIAGMGCYLFLQRCVGAEFTHSHEIPSAAGVSQEESPERRSAISARQLLILGMTGGIVPCPAALVVLLSAVALHRTGFGLFLIVAFSIGLAALLIAMGLAAVYAGRIMSRLPLEGPLIQRWLPMGSAAMISLLGLSIAIRGLMAAGILQIRMWS